MKQVGSYEAKTNLPKLLDAVSRGESITITKHGVPVAMLVPIEGKTKPDGDAVISQIKKFRKGKSLRGLSIRSLIEEGRRF